MLLIVYHRFINILWQKQLVKERIMQFLIILLNELFLLFYYIISCLFWHYLLVDWRCFVMPCNKIARLYFDEISNWRLFFIGRKLAALIAPRRKFMTVIQEDCIRVRASGLGRNTVRFSREFPRTGVFARSSHHELSASLLLPRVQLSKYRGSLRSMVRCLSITWCMVRQ